jgi:hypothetical protein
VWYAFAFCLTQPFWVLCGHFLDFAISIEIWGQHACDSPNQIMRVEHWAVFRGFHAFGEGFACVGYFRKREK